MSVYLTKIVSSYQFCKHYVNDGECISTYMIYNCNRMKYIIFRLLVSLYTLQHLYRLVNKRFKHIYTDLERIENYANTSNKHYI